MAGRLKRPIAPQIVTEEESGDSNYVSHGGSLHLAKGIAVTKRGMQHTAAGDKFLSLSRDDLEPLGSLGKGSSGSVKRVRHRATGQVFAVKEIKLGSDRHLAEIEKEISTLYNGENGEEELSSPHIIDFFGAYASDGSVFIALEAMDGSLMDVVQPSKGIPERVLAAITRSVLQGLQYLHKQRHLVHRDIKPQNLLYRQDGAVKITDFGVCSQLENTRAGTSSFVGTVTYMSPERLEGTNYSFSADIWSLGVTLMQLASGEHPYEKIVGTNRETEAKFWSLVQHLKEAQPPVPSGDYSSEFGDFVQICLRKDKDGRPGASELLAHPWITKHTKGDPADRDSIRGWLEERARELAAAPKAAPAMSQQDLLSALAAMEDFKR